MLCRINKHMRIFSSQKSHRGCIVVVMLHQLTSIVGVNSTVLATAIFREDQRLFYSEIIRTGRLITDVNGFRERLKKHQGKTNRDLETT